jgi:hypothetical protein
MAPPWVLDYVKMGLQALAEAAARTGAEKAATGGKKRGGARTKFANKNKATDKDYADAITALTKDGQFDKDKVFLPPLGGAYFSQGDYKNVPFPKIVVVPGEEDRTLKSGGCGPTALAIAIATLRPGSTTPREIARYAVDNKYSSPRSNPDGRGADMGMAKPLAKAHGLESVTLKSKDPLKVDKLRDQLKAGGVAVVHVRAGIFNYPGGDPERKPKSGHYIAINGFAEDKDGKQWFFVANPGKANPLKDRDADYFESKGMVIDDTLHPGAGMVRVDRETLERLMQEAYEVREPTKAAGAPAEGTKSGA